MTDYTGNFVEALQQEKKAEVRLRAIEGEYENTVARRQRAFLILARQAACAACAAFVGWYCKFDGADEASQVHEARAKIASERLRTVGVKT